MSTIFVVKTDGAEDRYVDAASRQDAFVHVASGYFHVRPLTKAEVVKALRAGVAVEVTEKARAAEKESAPAE